jgi:nicotinate phosphoribosyltransferase
MFPCILILLDLCKGPDGAMTASKFSYIGGFNGTSNLLAGMLYHLPVKGTHAHSYVMSHQSLSDLKTTSIRTPPSSPERSTRVEFLALVLEKRRLLGYEDRTHEGELAAFVSYACAFPHGFLALVDTYDTTMSGVPNFLSIGWALSEIGYKPVGIRLDSGDLAYLSVETRKLFRRADQIIGKEIFASCTIVASNDLNEEVIMSLERGSNEIDVYGQNPISFHPSYLFKTFLI